VCPGYSGSERLRIWVGAEWDMGDFV